MPWVGAPRGDTRGEDHLVSVLAGLFRWTVSLTAGTLAVWSLLRGTCYSIGA